MPIFTYPSGKSPERSYADFIALMRSIKVEVDNAITAYSSADQTRTDVDSLRDFLIREKGVLEGQLINANFLEESQRDRNDITYDPITQANTILIPAMEAYIDGLVSLFPDNQRDVQYVVLATDPLGKTHRTFTSGGLIAQAVPLLTPISAAIELET